MKIILNKCYGGFGVSNIAYELYANKKGLKLYPYWKDYKSNMFHKCVDMYNNKNTIIYYFIKDYGEHIHRDNINWNDLLYLDSEYRADPVLVEVVEELGEDANGEYAKLVIVDIPDGLNYMIDEYDGIETLHEKVKVW